MKRTLTALVLAIIAFVGVGLAWTLASDAQLGQPKTPANTSEAGTATTDPLIVGTPFVNPVFGVPEGINAPVENRPLSATAGNESSKSTIAPALVPPILVQVAAWSVTEAAPVHPAKPTETSFSPSREPVAILLTPVFKPLAVPRMPNQTLFFPMPEPTSPVWEVKNRGAYAQTLIFPAQEPEETTPARGSSGTVTIDEVSPEAAPERIAANDIQSSTGHDENYRWITGILTRKAGLANVWFLRYLPPDSPGDFHGGCVAIQTNVPMTGLSEGDLVTATGYIIRDAELAPSLRGTAYAAESVKRVK